MSRPPGPHKGRGAVSNHVGRFEAWEREAVDDGWDPREEEQPPPTVLIPDASRGILAHNRSPDVPFDQSLNPYRGCEHGCVYCYARPTHAYLGLSPGLDFETRILHKQNAAELLRRELARPGYQCTTIALGANTDPYQPVERRLRITRQVLGVLHACRHPVGIVTKSALVERDLDILTNMAGGNLVQVSISLTTLDGQLARRMEPRAAAPRRRLETIERLSRAGIPVTVLTAPIIPALTDGELEALLEAAYQAGARSASYVLLRLPLEVKELFQEWLDVHYPLKMKRVMSLVRDTRSGRLYDPTYGSRMRGTGEYADLIRKRFLLACRRLGYADPAPLVTRRFTPPEADARQLTLF